jgi:hypothetical protein
LQKNAVKFYGNNYDYTQDKGFDTVSETQDLCNEFGVNIVYYSYNEEKNSFKHESLIQEEQENKEEKNGDDNIVSILLHTGSTLKCSIINHAMIITNAELLTGLRFYGKCGLGFRTSDTHRARFNKHCEECDGKIHKKLKLNSSLAFAPCIMKKNALQYMLSHKVDLKNYKPVSSYITYDCETMNKNVVPTTMLPSTHDQTKATKIENTIHLLSLTYTVGINY